MSFRLTIANPCEQSWASMTPNSKGNYCSHCQKTVIDFSSLNDSEVIKVIEQTSGKICGRLTRQQINYEFSNSDNSCKLPIHKIIAGIALFGISNESNASLIPTSFKSTTTIQERSILNNHRIKATEINKIDTLKNVVEGVVLEALTKEPVPFSNVIISGTNSGTQADVNGKFILAIPDSLIEEKITLVVNSVSFDNFQFEINRKDLPLKKEILLKRTEITELMPVGELTVSQKKHWWQFWKKSCP